MELALLLFGDQDALDASIALALPAFELWLFMKIFGLIQWLLVLSTRLVNSQRQLNPFIEVANATVPSGERFFDVPVFNIQVMNDLNDLNDFSLQLKFGVLKDAKFGRL